MLTTLIKTSWLSLLILIVIVQPSMQSTHAAIETVEFNDPTLLIRYQSLITELRCLVCQNQNLADSDADLAKDLRRKTEEMLKAGMSDSEILSYMRERYGDFVLYRPPLNSTTYVLWIGPFALLIIASAGVLVSIKRKQNLDSATNNKNAKQDLAKIRNLLNKDS